MRAALNISKDIHSLTDFKRKTTELVAQLKTTGRPLVLTVNGKAELVIQDAASYQQVLDLMERVEAVEAIRRGLDQMYRGKGRPVAQFSKRMRRKYGIPR
jgi:prevent-host-death family protein